MTPGEVMQLPPADELLLVSGIHPIRAKKARYYEDRRLSERILSPPVLGKHIGRGTDMTADDWRALPLPVDGAEQRSESRQAVDVDPANAGIRREPGLPEHEEIVRSERPARPRVRRAGGRVRPRRGQGEGVAAKRAHRGATGGDGP